MSAPVRLGAVGYLNARPLVHGLERDAAVSIRFDVPAECARRLDAGEIDLGLVPSITYTSGHRVVPGVSIASDGPVASVAIFTRVPAREVRTLALDTSSRTSVALTRILCRRRFEIAPTFVPHAPDLPAMLAACDAALLIGDPALFVDHRAIGAEKIDLGSAWTDWTGLPFVWAFWMGRLGAASVDTRLVRRLQATRDAGVAASDEVADAFIADPSRRVVGRRYLRENIRYELNAGMLEGLRLYYRESAALDLGPAVRDVAFYD